MDGTIVAEELGVHLRQSIRSTAPHRTASNSKVRYNKNSQNISNFCFSLFQSFEAPGRPSSIHALYSSYHASLSGHKSVSGLLTGGIVRTVLRAEVSCVKVFQNDDGDHVWLFDVFVFGVHDLVERKPVCFADCQGVCKIWNN